MTITEAQLEQLCLQWFQDTGWSYAHGPDITPESDSPERANYRAVVLKNRLSQAVQRINPHLPPAVLDTVVHLVTTPDHPSLTQNNRTFHRLLMEGVPVEFTRDDKKEADHAQLIDFATPENNDFLVVNQFTISGTKQPRWPDIAVFINGLPLAVIELKNPRDENADVWTAYGQLQTYKDEISDLFVFNEALVVSDGITARVGSLTASKEWFLPWRTVRDENDTPLLEYELEKIVRGFFQPALFLDYVRYFVLFEQNGDTLIKKIAGYHQFHGVREAVRVTLIASASEQTERARILEDRAMYGRKVVPGSRKAGVFWHTQGSGKSISMCCYAGKLLQQPDMQNPTLIEDEEDLAIREKTKSRWAELAKLVGAQPRLKEVAEDLVDHYEARTATLEGKAMVVCMSRDICVSLFNQIIALRPDWEGTKLQKKGKDIGYNPEDGAIRIVMTGSAVDQEELRDHVFTQNQKKRLEKRFKDPNDPLKIVIVRDMWLTGFDAPSCHTMYIDKPMRGHNLMQAIARVNRVFKNKPGGLVVDYIGIAAELKNALSNYTDAKGRGTPTLDSAEALAILREKIDIVRGMFPGFDYSQFETNALALLVPAANHILGLDDGKKRFLAVVASVTKAYALCSTLDEATVLRTEMAFFSAIKVVMVKHTSVDRKREEKEKNSALKHILDNAVVAEGVLDVFGLAGLDKPNIGLLSNQFLEDVRNMPARNLAVELLEKLLHDEIRAHTRTNVVQEKQYSDRLLETLRRYHNRAIETAQVIEELIAMATDFQQDLKREEELGLTPDELAFYDALANNASAVRELSDHTLKKLATELTHQLRKSTTVDWQVRESVRARLRNLIRRLLRRYKYPPDGQPEAINLVLQQAGKLSDSWTATI